MAKPKRRGDRYILFHGELTDAPGRSEIWDEYIRYRGNNRWELIIEGTDFWGAIVDEPVREVMSTKRIIGWAQERDNEDLETGFEVLDEEDEYPEEERKFGSRTERLREIAVSVGATYCVSCLDRWIEGQWPPRKRVRVVDVKGITRRHVWLRNYHDVYDVETNLGAAYLYPPNKDRLAQLVLKYNCSRAEGEHVVKLSKNIIKIIDEIEPKL